MQYGQITRPHKYTAELSLAGAISKCVTGGESVSIRITERTIHNAWFTRPSPDVRLVDDHC